MVNERNGGHYIANGLDGVKNEQRKGML